MLYNDNIEFNTLWEDMVECGIATDAELSLACALCGTTNETLTSVLYIRTGCRSWAQVMGEDEED
jgi:hypothetical protein